VTSRHRVTSLIGGSVEYPVAITRDAHEKRAARIAAVLEELRGATEEMLDRSKEAQERAAQRVQDAKTVVEQSRALRATLKGARKR